MESLPENWKTIWGDFPSRIRLQAQLESPGRLELTTLAELWLRTLAHTGLHETDLSSGSVPKEPSYNHPNVGQFYSSTFPTKLEGSREVIWLRAEGHRTERGYKSVTILSAPLRTDVAILAALTSLEGKRIAPEELDDSAVEAFLRLSESTSDSVEMSEQEWMKGLMLMPKLEYVTALLRHFRPEFNDLSRENQLALVREACKRMNIYLEALHQLAAFLEYGSPGKDLRPAIEDAERDIRAAELQDIEGLSSVRLGEVLGVKAPASDEFKRTNSRASNMAKRGRRLLVNAFGEEGWQKLAEEKRAEQDQFLALSAEERGLVEFAEAEGLTIEEARQLSDKVNPEDVRQLFDRISREVDDED
jgi:hypothetical protein